MLPAIYLGFNTNPKNGRVKALSKACLDRTYLWAREPVKICSEAKYFHKKPPAMRVRDKNL